MIYFEVDLERYNWHIDCFVTADNLEINKIMRYLDDIGCSDDIKVRAYHILEDQLDSGFAYSNPRLQQSIMVINMSTSMDEFINTYNHEKNHIEMHICNAFNIDPYSEEAAELSGDMAQIFYFSMLQSLNQHY